MKTFALIFTLSLLTACAKAPQRMPASLKQIDQGMNERPELQVEFIDSGSDETKRRYDIKAEVFCNDPHLIKKVEIIVGKVVMGKIKLIYKGDQIFIDQKMMYLLPIGKTVLRFDLGESGSRDIELVCTRAGRCL